MKSKKGNRNRWEDHFSRRAKKEHYPARSVYKLQEIQKKFNLIKKGHSILDLGCAPGSWLKYAAEVIGTSGSVTGIDLKPVSGNFPAQVQVLTDDVFNLDRERLGELKNAYHVVLSDMAPATSGNKTVDAARSSGLCEMALMVAESVLKPGGSFVCKIFQGQDFKQFTDTVRNSFTQVKIFKPQSSRKASREIFVIGIGYKGKGPAAAPGLEQEQ